MLTIIFISAAIVTASGIGYGFGKRKASSITYDDGSIKWVWDGIKRRYRCPKCQIGISDQEFNVPVYCSCTEHHSGHYHYKCEVCEYSAIMRSADNP